MVFGLRRRGGQRENKEHDCKQIFGNAHEGLQLLLIQSGKTVKGNTAVLLNLRSSKDGKNLGSSAKG